MKYHRICCRQCRKWKQRRHVVWVDEKFENARKASTSSEDAVTEDMWEKKNLLNFIFPKTRCEPKRDLNFTGKKTTMERVELIVECWFSRSLLTCSLLRIRLPCFRLILRNLRIVCFGMCLLSYTRTYVYSIRNRNIAFSVNF